jgi:hypothetical protein
VVSACPSNVRLPVPERDPEITSNKRCGYWIAWGSTGAPINKNFRHY